MQIDNGSSGKMLQTKNELLQLGATLLKTVALFGLTGECSELIKSRVVTGWEASHSQGLQKVMMVEVSDMHRQI